MRQSTEVAVLAGRWAEALESWAIPPEVRERAERDPWVLPVERFCERAVSAMARPDGPSFERAAEVLRERPGSVLDVGAGAGAASLPLARWATSITAVDPHPVMLTAFASGAQQCGVDYRTVEGTWPHVADHVPAHDVAVVHHVVYNVADIVPFLAALDRASRRRVVLELSTHHPLSWLNPLWERFHGITRPTVPTAGDLVEILVAMDLHEVRAEHWSTPGPTDLPGEAGRLRQAELVTQRLCLPSSRATEVADALADLRPAGRREVVTVSWSPGY